MNVGSGSEDKPGSVDINASLIQVPPEILWDITSYITEPKDLASLVRVCKRVYEICVPRLYQRIKLSPADLRNPNSLLKNESHNLRHVRSIEVAGDMEESAGYWVDNLSDEDFERISCELNEPLNKLLSHLEDNTLTEFM
ncbi:hypothetical protein TWF481_000568 [Arthrobotrys musiformis]|uniref:F-box domain-containing protein n=1 Tax=Arthrobotrys musiformis TaxID=47236 RepID=A0AAV9WP33_9PEZI